MKYLPRISALLMVFILLALVACGSGTTNSPTSDPNLVYTQIWQTVVAGQTQTVAAMPPVPTDTNTPETTSTPKPTNTPLISATPLPGTSSATPVVKTTPQSTAQQTCDNASFGGDITYTDGSVVPAGQTLVKTWRIKNLGPCSWNQDYLLIFGWGGDGTNWNTVQPVHFSALVTPGQTIDLSVSLSAPSKAGSYAATFRTQNDKGYNFGPTLTILVTVK